MIDPKKVEKFMVVARAYGFEVGAYSWFDSDGAGRPCCCPMGAVLVSVNGGEVPSDDLDWTSLAAEALGAKDTEVGDFVNGFDGNRYWGPRESRAYRLGRQFAKQLGGG